MPSLAARFCHSPARGLHLRAGHASVAACKISARSSILTRKPILRNTEADSAQHGSRFCATRKPILRNGAGCAMAAAFLGFFAHAARAYGDTTHAASSPPNGVAEALQRRFLHVSRAYRRRKDLFRRRYAFNQPSKSVCNAQEKPGPKGRNPPCPARHGSLSQCERARSLRSKPVVLCAARAGTEGRTACKNRGLSI